MTQELIPALIRADTGYQLFTFPRHGIRELLLDRSVIKPIKHCVIYPMTVRALPSHRSTTLPHSKQSPTLRYSTSVPCLTASIYTLKRLSPHTLQNFSSFIYSPNYRYLDNSPLRILFKTRTALLIITSAIKKGNHAGGNRTTAFQIIIQ